MPPGGWSGGSGIGRGALLAIANGVNLADTAVVAVELSTGRRQLALTGLSLVVTAPTLIYVGNQLRSDPTDALLLGTAAWTTALVTKSVVDLILHHDPTSPESNRRTIIQPTFGPGVPIGVDLAGSF
jgi:hypothetical protein